MIYTAPELRVLYSDRNRLTEAEAMKLGNAYLLTRSETRDWKIRVGAQMRSTDTGSCNYRLKTIFLTKYLINNRTPEGIRDEILQLMAHAITGQWNFSQQWIETAIQLGASHRTVTQKLLRAS